MDLAIGPIGPMWLHLLLVFRGKKSNEQLLCSCYSVSFHTLIYEIMENRNWARINGIWCIFLISGNYLLFRQGIACHGKCKLTFIIFLSSFHNYFISPLESCLINTAFFLFVVQSDSFHIGSDLNHWSEVHHAIFHEADRKSVV